MIDIEMRSLLNSAEALNILSEKNLPARAAFQISRIMKEVDLNYQSFQTARAGLIDKYAKKDDDGQLAVNEKNEATIKQEFIQEFNSEVNDLLDLTVHLNASAIRLRDLEELEFTPQQMLALEPFIEIG